MFEVRCIICNALIQKGDKDAPKTYAVCDLCKSKIKTEEDNMKVLYPYDEICLDCAAKLGGYIDDRDISLRKGICPVCGKEKWLGHPNDFDIVLVEKVILRFLRIKAERRIK